MTLCPLIRRMRLYIKFLFVRLRFRYPFFSPVPHGYKPWESLWGCSATSSLVDFHHRQTACPSYIKRISSVSYETDPVLLFVQTAGPIRRSNHRKNALVLEMTHTGIDHRNTVFVADIDRQLVLDRSARLDDRRHTGLDRFLYRIRHREEGI